MFSATRFLLAATTILAKSVSISAKRDIGPDEANSTNDAHFILDSGANIHICNDASLFVRFYKHKDINKPYVTVASGEALPIQAIGDIQLSLLLPDGTKSIQIIKNVYYVPTSAVNVFSVRRLWKDNNAKVRFRDNAIVTFSDGVRLVLPAISSHYTLVVDSKTKKNIASEWNRPQVSYGSRSQTPIDDDVIHRRLGHCGQQRIIKTGLNSRSKRVRNYKSHSKCEACAAGGARNKRVQKHSTRQYTYFGERISSDLCGPFPKSAHGDFEYSICFTDAFSRYAAVYYLKSKGTDEVKAALKQFIKDHKRWLKRGVREWHTDNGGEFCSKLLDDFCEEISVKRHYSVPYTPALNGQAERIWGLLLRPMRTLLYESGVPDVFWPECMAHCVQLHNSLSKSHGLPPLQILTGRSIDHDKFGIWGSKVFYTMPVRYRINLFKNRKGSNKLRPTAIKSVYLGCDPERRGGHLLFIPQLNRITTGFTKQIDWDFEGEFIDFKVPSGSTKRQDGEFEDDDFDDIGAPPGNKPNTTPEPIDRDANNDDPDTITRTNEDGDYVHGDTQDFIDHCSDTRCTLGKHPDGTPHSYQNIGVTQGPPATRLNHRVRKQAPDPNVLAPAAPRARQDANVHCITDADCFSFAFREPFSDQDIVLKISEFGPIPIPKSADEALSGPLRRQWKEAMQLEITKLLENQVWDPEERSVLSGANRKSCKSKWVFDVKYNKDGTLKKLKARFVCCGYSQIQGLDYDRSFSSTMRASSFRLLLALATAKGLQINHIDVTNAYVQAELDDVDIWIEPPAKFESWYDVDGVKTSKVLKLKKALYGTKQAGRLWQQKLRAHLLSPEQGFTNLPSDPCLFRRTNKLGTIIIGVYVVSL